MRIKEKHVRNLCQKLLYTLRAKQLIVLKKKEGEILERMVEIFMKDLNVEAEIDREARRLLEAYIAQAPNQQIDRHKMFLLIKKQLIKERKVVI